MIGDHLAGAIMRTRLNRRYIMAKAKSAKSLKKEIKSRKEKVSKQKNKIKKLQKSLKKAK